MPVPLATPSSYNALAALSLDAVLRAARVSEVIPIRSRPRRLTVNVPSAVVR